MEYNTAETIARVLRTVILFPIVLVFVTAAWTIERVCGLWRAIYD